MLINDLHKNATYAISVLTRYKTAEVAFSITNLAVSNHLTPTNQESLPDSNSVALDL